LYGPSFCIKGIEGQGVLSEKGPYMVLSNLPYLGTLDSMKP